MYLREELEEGLERYKKLFLLWTFSTAVLVGANLVASLSPNLALVFFLAGAVLLAAAGISCAYTIAKENM